MGCVCSPGFYCTDSDVLDKTALITGANQGIGYYTAMALVKKGMHVIVACRDPHRGELAAGKLRRCRRNARVDVVRCDLADFASVRECARAVEALGCPVHSLVLNAGVMMAPYEATVDGHELHFQTNHLSHMLLTVLLLPILQRSAPSTIAVVSSVAHIGTHVRFDDFKDNYDPWSAYANSKLCNILFANELRSRLSLTSDVTVTTCHPGVIRTSLWKHARFFEYFLCKFGRDGAKPVIHAALDFVRSSRHQRDYVPFYVPRFCWTGSSGVDSSALDGDVAQRLWDYSCQCIGVSEDDLEACGGLLSRAPVHFKNPGSRVLLFCNWCPCCYCCC